jgi:hypothetical protein
MRKVWSLLIFAVLVAGCEAPGPQGPSPEQQAIKDNQQLQGERRWAVIQQKERDVALCRDRGGVPVTKKQELAGGGEYWQELVRCELPCGEKQPQVSGVEK